MTINIASLVRKSAHQVSCELNGEVAILNLKSTLYFGLDQVGATVWEAIDGKKTVGDLCGAVCEKFDVEDAQCASDIVDLIAKLNNAGLVEVVS